MKKSLFALFCLALSSNVTSQTQRPDCTGAEHRLFDFWVGHWEVTSKEGKLQGHNLIELQLDDCTLQEHWQGAKGSTGKSFNFYDRQTKQWHQTWIDNSGGVLYLNGGLDDKVMVLSGERLDREGKPVQHRIKYTPLKDGRVEQHWEMSRDKGESWQDLFLGYYKKKSDPSLM